jgi:hypothetical protein
VAIVYPELSESVPGNLRDLVENIGLWVPDKPAQEEIEVYDRAINGQCMTCSAELGDTTMLTLNRAGVIMIYCGGACYTDQQVVGWMMEQYDDMVQKIKFRGEVDADG